MVYAELILAPFWVAPRPPGQTRARTGYFLMGSLSAGAPEVALANLVSEMAIFLVGVY